MGWLSSSPSKHLSSPPYIHVQHLPSCLPTHLSSPILPILPILPLQHSFPSPFSAYLSCPMFLFCPPLLLSFIALPLLPSVLPLSFLCPPSSSPLPNQLLYTCPPPSLYHPHPIDWLDEVETACHYMILIISPSPQLMNTTFHCSTDKVVTAPVSDNLKGNLAITISKGLSWLLRCFTVY